MLVLLGRFNLDLWDEMGSIVRGVKGIKIHPDWKFDSYKWDADIAIIEMSERVTFTMFIQPVCIFTSDMPGHGSLVTFVLS